MFSLEKIQCLTKTCPGVIFGNRQYLFLIKELEFGKIRSKFRVRIGGFPCNTVFWKNKRKKTGRRRKGQAAAYVLVVGKPEYLKTAWDFTDPRGSRKYGMACHAARGRKAKEEDTV